MVEHVSKLRRHHVVDNAVFLKDEVLKRRQVGLQVKTGDIRVKRGNPAIILHMQYCPVHGSNHQAGVLGHLPEGMGVDSDLQAVLHMLLTAGLDVGNIELQPAMLITRYAYHISDARKQITAGRSFDGCLQQDNWLAGPAHPANS